MAKGRDQQKAVKKEPLKTAKEKKEEKKAPIQYGGKM